MDDDGLLLLQSQLCEQSITINELLEENAKLKEQYLIAEENNDEILAEYEIVSQKCQSTTSKLKLVQQTLAQKLDNIDLLQEELQQLREQQDQKLNQLLVDENTGLKSDIKTLSAQLFALNSQLLQKEQVLNEKSKEHALAKQHLETVQNDFQNLSRDYLEIHQDNQKLQQQLDTFLVQQAHSQPSNTVDASQVDKQQCQIDLQQQEIGELRMERDQLYMENTYLLQQIKQTLDHQAPQLELPMESGFSQLQNEVEQQISGILERFSVFEKEKLELIENLKRKVEQINDKYSELQKQFVQVVLDNISEQFRIFDQKDVMNQFDHLNNKIDSVETKIKQLQMIKSLSESTMKSKEIQTEPEKIREMNARQTEADPSVLENLTLKTKLDSLYLQTKQIHEYFLQQFRKFGDFDQKPLKNCFDNLKTRLLLLETDLVDARTELAEIKIENSMLRGAMI